MDKNRASGHDRTKRILPEIKPYRSPAEIILILVVSVFFAEFFVMVILYYFRERLDPVYIVFIDAPLLMLFLSPILYFFIFRPLITLVDERQAAETALMREKNRFQRYLEVAGVMVVVLDEEGRVQLANRKASEILGYREDEILGRNWFQSFVPERIRDEVALEFASLRSGRREAEGYFENPVLNRRGEEREILWHNTILEDEGRVVGTLSSGEDITERKVTEKALMESEARYRLVHNTAFDGIVIANALDRIMDCNDSAAKIFGYSKDDLIGQSVSVLMPDKHRKQHQEGLRRFLETGKSKVQGRVIEYEGLRKNGEVFPLELALNNFTLGGIIHFTAMIRDITERKRAEREKEMIQARLSQSQKMEAIGRFAGGIAHDFNNILTAIRGNAELALEEVTKADPAYPKLDGIVTSVMLASKLTRQLLLFSRGEPFELVPLNMNKLMEDLLVMIPRIIGEGITISTDLDPGLWTMEADEGNIEQVIMNLAVNARDAMPAGGKLTIKTGNAVISGQQAETIPDARPGEAVCLTVADTGVGIEREFLPRLFEPFFTTKEAGTGFGLSIVYSIVKQHNGWITVASEPGKGTTFKICFPAMLKARAGEAREPKLPRGSGELVLLVEDDARVREFTRTVLAEHGFSVTEAGSAKEALDALGRVDGALNLLLSDVILPDQNGFQLAELVLSKNPGASVILTSSYLDKAGKPRLEGKGYGFLQKPYSISSLLKAVMDSLERKG